MTPWHPTPFSFAWHLLTRLGELQIMLPVLLAATWSLRRAAPQLAVRWLGAAAVAIALTAATKIAFIGYGWGWAALDFTGVSGHAMMAAIVLPTLVSLAAGAWTDRAAGAGFAAGAAMALGVGVSRVALGAHSWSEAAAGVALGAAVGAVALEVTRAPRANLPRALPLALLVALPLAVAEAPPSRTHDWVTRLALSISGRPQPYTRWQLHHDHRQAAAAAAPVSN